eukprot:scaffold1551_cov166-Amphora_coffeaeformis.AAC.8
MRPPRLEFYLTKKQTGAHAKYPVKFVPCCNYAVEFYACQNALKIRTGNRRVETSCVIIPDLEKV